jgi:hypothetical protein
MPNINIQTLNYTDPQSVVIDRLNHNFDEIIEANGGSQGLFGPTGFAGPIGGRGPVGPSGSAGIRGSRWYVQPTTPLQSTVVDGDFWVNSLTGEINEFSESGWNFTGYTLAADGNIFLSSPSTYTSGATAGSSIMLDRILPDDYLFVVADKVPESGVLNENLSKFMISTDPSVNDSPILEFSRTDLENGTVADYSKHPLFRWKNFDAEDNSVIFQIPGGAFIIGASGGFTSTFSNLNVASSLSTDILYGATSGSGIYSTGGFNINSPSGQFNIISSFINITGGSGSISAPVNATANLDSNTLSSYIYAGGPTGSSGLTTSRMSDTFQTLSHSVYNVSLESSSGREFFIDTKGKVKTNKYETSIQYASTTPGATSVISARTVNWYLISRPGTPVTSSVLENGNTIVLNPSVPTNTYIGVGIYDGNEYSWGGSGGLDYGQSIDIDVHFSPNTVQPGFSDGFRYIGKGATAGNATSVINLPFAAATVEFTVARGVTGGNTSVFYRAYGQTGGSGGSFVL